MMIRSEDLRSPDPQRRWAARFAAVYLDGKQLQPGTVFYACEERGLVRTLAGEQRGAVRVVVPKRRLVMLREAWKLATEKGVDSVTMQEAASRAMTSLSYAHMLFGGTRDLVREAIELAACHGDPLAEILNLVLFFPEQDRGERLKDSALRLYNGERGAS